jgi:hypothetical protein
MPISHNKLNELVRKALIKNYYEDVFSSPDKEMNWEYLNLLHTNNITT